MEVNVFSIKNASHLLRRLSAHSMHTYDLPYNLTPYIRVYSQNLCETVFLGY
jgi:hypothetical protein